MKNVPKTTKKQSASVAAASGGGVGGTRLKQRWTQKNARLENAGAEFATKSNQNKICTNELTRQLLANHTCNQ